MHVQMPAEAHNIVEKFMTLDSGLRLHFSEQVICIESSMYMYFDCVFTLDRFNKSLLTRKHPIMVCLIEHCARLFIHLCICCV